MFNTLCKVSPLLAKPDEAEVVFSVFAKPIGTHGLNPRDAAATWIKKKVIITK